MPKKSKSSKSRSQSPKKKGRKAGTKLSASKKRSASMKACKTRCAKACEEGKKMKTAKARSSKQKRADMSNEWLIYVAEHRDKYPNLAYKEVLQKLKAPYRKHIKDTTGRVISSKKRK